MTPNLPAFILIASIVVLASAGCGEARDRAPSSPISGSQLPLRGRLAPKGDLEGFRSEGEWAYTWPHDHVPGSIEGYSLLSGPFDPSSPNSGRTMANWGKPVVWQASKTSAVVSVWCHRDFTGRPTTGPITTPAPLENWGHWSTATFSSLALPCGPAGEAVQLSTTRAEAVVFLVFRARDTLFRIEARATTLDAARKAAMDVSTAICDHQLRKTSGGV